MSFKALDLNLLAVFEAVDRERNITRAAEMLGRSQPAVSHALNRLRHLTKDPLFVRTPSGMLPTPRAQEMIGPVRQAIVGLRSALGEERFDPGTARETFTIAMNNFGAIVFAAPLIARLAAKAPNIKVVIRPSGTLDISMLLARGQLDLAVGETPGPDAGDQRFLLSEQYVAVRKNGTQRPRKLTLQHVAAAQHLRISSIGDDDSFVDAEMARHGLTRVIACEAPYIAAGDILEQADLLAVVASRVGASLCKGRNLIACPLPFDAPPMRIGMKWTQRHDGRPSHRWLRGELTSLVDDLSSG